MVQVVNNPPANAGDMGLTPGLGRSPEEGNGNPFQCSCLGSPMDRGAWWTTVHGVAKEKSQTLLSDWTTTTKANLYHRHGIYLSPPIFIVLKIFWCEPLLKSLLNLLQYCSCFMFWYFWLWGMQDLSSSTRDWTCTLCTEMQSLNHWTARDAPFHYWHHSTCSAHGLTWWYPPPHLIPMTKSILFLSLCL